MKEQVFEETVDTSDCKAATEIMRKIEDVLIRLRDDACCVAKQRLYDNGWLNAKINAGVFHYRENMHRVDVKVYLTDCEDEPCT